MNLPVSEQAGAHAYASSPASGHSTEAAELPPCPLAFAEAERRLLRRIGRLAELPDKRRDVLASMLRLGVQWRDASEWFALKFDTIARELGCSYNTVNNHVQALKVDGWVERQRDITGARRNGMPVGLTRLTDLALAELGLVQHAQPPEHACRDLKEKSPSERNAPQAPPVDNAARPNPEPSTHPPEPQATSRSACVMAPDGSRIPADLAPLLMGMTGRQLCAAMRLAGPLGVRLQHIAARALSAILDADKPVAYLRFLVRSGRDWTAPPSVRRETALPVSIKSRNTLAGEREDMERERKAAEHRAQRSKPRAEHLQVFAALKLASRLRELQAAD
jgi:hypothetical protein